MRGLALFWEKASRILEARVGEIQNSEGRVKTLPPDAVKDGCGEEGVLGARVGVGGWVGGGAGGGHLMGPLSSRQLRPAAEAALVSVRDLATDQSAPPSQLIFSFNCEPVIQLCIGATVEASQSQGSSL